MLMKTLIEGFDKQLQEAIVIANRAVLKPHDRQIKNIVITGLGGSGIGGKIVSDIISEEAQIPILINSDYGLPNFVDSSTLVIVSSYSGNTEETLSSMKLALEKGAEVACITSGGVVKDLAEQHGLNHIIVPGGNPPRACLGYSMVQLFRLMQHYQITSGNYLSAVEPAIDLIVSEQESIKQLARQMAENAQSKTAILYAEAGYEGVIIRLRQQLNENSKALCWHHVLPEMNHNELVGWGGGKSEYEVFLFRTEDDHKRTAKRMDLCTEIMSKKAHVNTIWAKGNNKLERQIYLINLGDWMSWYLSELNGVDAVEIEVIDFLKGELSKF